MEYAAHANAPSIEIDLIEEKVKKASIKLFGEEKDIRTFMYSVLPRDYALPDFVVSIDQIHLLPAKTKIVTYGYIDSVKIQHVNSPKIAVITANLYKDGQSVKIKWTVSKAKANAFLYAIQQKIKKNIVTKEPPFVQVSGKIGSFSPNKDVTIKYIADPEILSLGFASQKASSLNEKVVPQPKYKLKQGISHREIRSVFGDIIKHIDVLSQISEGFMPKEIEEKFKMQSLKKSLSFLHGYAAVPREKLDNFVQYDGFKRRVLAEKVWDIVKKSQNAKETSIPSNIAIEEKDINIITNILERLPFELTKDQKKAIWGILKNISSKGASKNLLFGDVGTGKTMVSLIIAEIFSQKGFQSAILAPTSILAKQHFEEARALFGDKVFLLHSKTKKSEKRKIEKALENKEPIIIYGTSSLNGLPFTNLGFIVIDEEQKFGVEDKERLYKKFFPNAHTLYMTATPLPRTLTGAIFSDFKAFTIKEKPKQQIPRITTIVDPERGISAEFLNYITYAMSKGEQTLVIVPSIFSDETVNTATAKEKYEKLFPHFKIASVHGQMDGKDIEKTMEEFMEGKFNILIATTMVDAGFSNKNLSFVFIENPERFGIAQMHQIRGRVGRGNKQGYCFLCPTRPFYTLKEETRARLQTVANTEDGFFLSKKDMELRGTGDLLGTAQSRGEINLLEWKDEIEEMKKILQKTKKMD